MPIITNLTLQKRNKERVNVFLDGEYAFSLSLITAVRLGIGDELDEAALAAIQLEDGYQRAQEAAIQLISYRPRSVAEVRRRLQERSFEPLVIDQAITRLQELELLGDDAFARYWVDQRESFKPLSERALRQELQQKGVARDVIDTAVAEVDELDAAVRAAHQKISRYAHLPEPEFRQKLGGYLQRRGFPYDIIREVTQSIWDHLQHE